MKISIALLMSSLINYIQALQYRWKNCADHKGNYVEKLTSFGPILYEYHGQPRDFSANPPNVRFKKKNIIINNNFLDLCRFLSQLTRIGISDNEERSVSEIMTIKDYLPARLKHTFPASRKIFFSSWISVLVWLYNEYQELWLNAWVTLLKSGCQWSQVIFSPVMNRGFVCERHST